MRGWLSLFICALLQLSADNQIVSWITRTKQAILAASGAPEKDCLFLTFWNFDETILDGDSTEGKEDIYGQVIFKGLAEVAIEAGFSKQYPTFSKFWKDYKAMEAVDEPKAYAYCAQILAGAEEAKVLALSTQYFASTLKSHLYPSSLDIIRSLQKGGISVQVLTASPRVFVQGAAPLLGIPVDDVYGMETTLVNGYLTSQMVLPLTTGKGKIEKIQVIVKEKLRKYKKVYVLAGFGNYNKNDMPFVEWTAAQNFPVGEPLGVVDYNIPDVQAKNVLLLPLRL
jgi:phosphoserine phosphatase